ncbi:MAG: DUF4921 family protein [bacterium]|nr:DUF4921 family protein [bacterium]
MDELGGQSLKKAKNFHKPKLFLNNKPNEVIEKTDFKAGEQKNNLNPKPLNLKISPDQPSEIRKDYINDYYVLVAPKRHARPFDTVSHFCPFFETEDSPRLDEQTEVYSLRDKENGWLTKVVDNKFPSLSTDNSRAYGKQEIVIDTPLSNTAAGDLDQKQLIDLLLTYRQRIKELLKLPNIKYVLVFKNHGIEAGASLAHAHSQIFALPMIPQNFVDESSKIEDYYKTKNADPIEKIIDFERAENKRIVSENKDFISICPYAPRWPLEAWIIAKRKVQNFSDLTNLELSSLSKLLHQIIHKLTDYNVSYNFYLQNGVSEHQRFMLKVESRNLNTWGGFEVATGMIINTVPPESSAEWYKT